MKPDLQQIPEWYRPYVAVLDDKPIVELLRESLSSFEQLFGEITEEKSLSRYAEGKWSIKEVLQHIMDTERIFAYRALRFSRGDQNDLSGFDQNAYVDQSMADRRPLAQLIHEFSTIRRATIALFEGMDDAWLDREGTANSYSLSVRAIGYITVGHQVHHVNIIRNKYL
ncbi:MAG: DinB family protein [Cyclobacteriaceae bacterium]|nr:DinB family protein [Cyclobacteriaceae bacterium]